MANKLVIVCHGFMGSELYLPETPRKLFWVHKSEMARLGFNVLALKGLNQDQPDYPGLEENLTVGKLLPPNYGDTVRILTAQLKDKASVTTFAYDL